MKYESLNKNPHLGFLNNIDWMNAQASEIFISVNDRNHPELPVLSASQEWGMIYRDEGGMNIFHDVANEITYKRVRPGQFVIHLRSFQGGFAHSKVEGITSPAYTILDFKDKNKHNDLFWKYVLTSDEFIKRLELITYGIRDGRSINFSDFSTLKFYFPSYEVQLKVGTFLSHVDSLIQAKTKKLESLKAIKKSLLQKCFPKAGEKVPEMRFAGFSGEWKEKKLGEIAVFSKGHGYSKNDLIPDGDPIILYGRMYTNYETVISNIETFVHKQENSVLSKGGEIIIPASGETAEDIARASVVEKKGIILGGDINIVSLPKSVYDPSFVALSVSHGESQKELCQNAQGKTIVHLHNDDIRKISILFPSLTEQQKIGQFFSKYDSIISAQQKEIDKLKDIKKSLLQKMFV